MTHWVNWLGLVAVIAGWIFSLIAFIYIGVTNNRDDTFWALFIVGLSVMLFGLALLLLGYFLTSKNGVHVAAQITTSPNDISNGSYVSARNTYTPPSGFAYVKPNAQ